MKKFKELRANVQEGALSTIGKAAGKSLWASVGAIAKHLVTSSSAGTPIPLNIGGKKPQTNQQQYHVMGPGNVKLASFPDTPQGKKDADAYAVTRGRGHNVVVEAAELSDAQKLALMGDKQRVNVLMALSRLKKSGDINKLPPKSRKIVTDFYLRTGGLNKINKSIAITTLRSYRNTTE